MGGYLVYYGLVLAVFAPLGIVPLATLWGTLQKLRPSVAGSGGGLVLCLQPQPRLAVP